MKIEEIDLEIPEPVPPPTLAWVIRQDRNPLRDIFRLAYADVPDLVPRTRLAACRCPVCDALWYIEPEYALTFHTKNEAGEFVRPCIGPDGLVHDNWKNFTRSAL